MEEKIIKDLKESYGIAFHKIVPVSGGWLNKKWCISTDKGELLVKQYSYERFNKEKLELIESALQRQVLLEQEGIPCPHLYLYEGRAIRLLDENTAYMVMDFHQGKIIDPENITIEQMHSLGSATGLMHRSFFKLPVSTVAGFPIDEIKMIESLRELFCKRQKECPVDASAEYRNALNAQQTILDRLTPDLFQNVPKGIAHEDFTPDNMLFKDNGISAIIDFDRNCYTFVWHDVGRALLSFALKDGKMDMTLVHAFLKGYTQHMEIEMKNIADVLRISWCIEIPWWIQPKIFESSNSKILRFKEEMLWITKNWDSLDAMICS